MGGRASLLWGVFVAVAVSVGGRAAQADTLTFPGPEPCDASLVECIAEAAEGDVIELATNGPIAETIVISKSLTLAPAQGFTPTFGALQDIGVELEDPAKTVVLRGLRLTNGRIDVDTTGIASHSVTVTDCAVTTTAASTSTHGIYFNVTSPATLVAERNLISSNGSPLGLFTGTGSGTVSVSFSSNNIRKYSAGYGSNGIELDLRGGFVITADVRSNVLSDVADCGCGGAAAMSVRPADTVSVTANIVNNTIDLSPSYGIRIYPPAVGQLVIANVYNNVVTRTDSALLLPAANPQLTVNNGFNDFFNNTGAPGFGGYVSDPSNLAVDPLYASLVGRDYHLQSGSSLRNAGTNSPPGGLSEFDADGNLRVEGSAVDIGAYEFGSSPPTTTSTTVSPTTTTLPACAPAATTASVLCRLDALGAAVQAQVPAGALADKLGTLVSRARTAVAAAETATKPKARKRALAAAIRATGGIGKKLRSRKAKDVDADTRTTLGAAADAIRADLKALKSQ